jgi:hypothetical protein
VPWDGVLPDFDGYDPFGTPDSRKKKISKLILLYVFLSGAMDPTMCGPMRLMAEICFRSLDSRKIKYQNSSAFN